MADIPHFDLPFRYVGGQPVVAEQDSLADVINSVKAILMTQIGQRVEVPEFGIDQPVFQEQPVNLAPILTQINTYEPRADIVLDQHPNALDAMIDEITAKIDKREV